MFKSIKNGVYGVCFFSQYCNKETRIETVYLKACSGL